jgi:hypothetical protein
MPMGATNAHPTFIAVAVGLKIDLMKLIVELDGIDQSLFDSKVIVDEVIVVARTMDIILCLFRQCLQILQHHRITLQLRKC